MVLGLKKDIVKDDQPIKYIEKLGGCWCGLGIFSMASLEEVRLCEEKAVSYPDHSFFPFCYFRPEKISVSQRFNL